MPVNVAPRPGKVHKFREPLEGEVGKIWQYLQRVIVGPTWNFDQRSEKGRKELWLQKWNVVNKRYEDVLELSTLTNRTIWLYATGQAPGNLTLSDVNTWNERYSLLTSLKVWTASTDWDLWICGDVTFDTAIIGSRKLIENQNGNYEVYESEIEYRSDGTNVYLKYVDNSGANNAEILLTGVARRH